MKPGINSSEFWMAVVVVILGAISVVFFTNPWAQVGGIVAAALVSAGYSFSRGAVKAKDF